MSDSTAALAYFSRISQCGKTILEVENMALESNLLSLFNKRNHEEFVVVLGRMIDELQAISKELRLNSANVRQTEGLQRLILALVEFANAMSIVCAGLNKKTLGRPYLKATYTADLNMVDIKRAACEQAQLASFT